MVSIQWYPGHIAKYERQLKELLKLVDVVVEVLDARMPLATTNPRLKAPMRDKPRLVVLTKADLADEAQTRRWKAYLAQEADRVISYDSRSGRLKERLADAVVALGEAKMQKLEAKGLKRRPVRVLVAGMPNVGKSSLINSVVGRKKTQTGHKAGVTRQPQWVRIHPAVELLDTPGVIPPFLESDETGALLAVVSSVGEAAFDDEEVARFLLERIEALYPGCLRQYYHVPVEQELGLEAIAESRHYKLGGDAPDTLRAAQALLSDFRQARTGRLSLQHAHHNPDAQKTEPAEPAADL